MMSETSLFTLVLFPQLFLSNSQCFKKAREVSCGLTWTQGYRGGVCLPLRLFLCFNKVNITHMITGRLGWSIDSRILGRCLLALSSFVCFHKINITLMISGRLGRSTVWHSNMDTGISGRCMLTLGFIPLYERGHWTMQVRQFYTMRLLIKCILIVSLRIFLNFDRILLELYIVEMNKAPQNI